MTPAVARLALWLLSTAPVETAHLQRWSETQGKKDTVIEATVIAILTSQIGHAEKPLIKNKTSLPIKDSHRGVGRCYWIGGVQKVLMF